MLDLGRHSEIGLCFSRAVERSNPPSSLPKRKQSRAPKTWERKRAFRRPGEGREGEGSGPCWGPSLGRAALSLKGRPWLWAQGSHWSRCDVGLLPRGAPSGEFRLLASEIWRLAFSARGSSSQGARPRARTKNVSYRTGLHSGHANAPSSASKAAGVQCPVLRLGS